MNIKFKAFWIAVATFIAMGGVATACHPKQAPQPPVVVQSDKLDTECTGQETAGRCADKFVCPDDTTPVDEANHICQPNPPIQAAVPAPATPFVEAEAPAPFQGK